MKPYVVKTPRFIPAIYRRQTWGFSSKKKELYFTFDDGPTPEITEWVLDLLMQYKAKATFFCIGKNIEQYPKIFERILQEGHGVGNHTYNHLNGWKTVNSDYLLSIEQTQKIIETYKVTSTKSQINSYKTNSQQPEIKLFRPPYGKIRPSQVRYLKTKGYEVIMWSVLSGDFDTNLTLQECEYNVINNAKGGDIIVFHDSIKASNNLKNSLPNILEFFSKQGFSFKKISATDIAAQD